MKKFIKNSVIVISLSVMSASCFAGVEQDKLNLIQSYEDLATLQGKESPITEAFNNLSSVDKFIGVGLSQNYSCMDIASVYQNQMKNRLKGVTNLNPVAIKVIGRMVDNSQNYMISRCNEIIG